MELFVTDLDGTLINKDRKVTQKSVEIINNLISLGMNFTVATARTPPVYIPPGCVPGIVIQVYFTIKHA